MKTLQDALHACSDEQLRRIYRLWGLSREADDEKHPALTHLALITGRVTHAITLRFIWEHLTADEREVFYSLLKPQNRNGIEHSQLPGKVNLPADRFEAALSALFSYALVYEEMRDDLSKTTKQSKKTTPILFVFPYKELVTHCYETGREIFAQIHSPIDITHLELLNTFQSTTLSEIVTANNFSDPQYTQSPYDYLPMAVMRSLIANEFRRPTTAISALSHLSPEIRSFLDWFYAQGRQISMHDVRTHTMYDDSELSTLLQTLTQAGVAFDCMLKTGERALFVPADLYPTLLAALPKASLPLPPAGFETISEPPPFIKPGEACIQYDLATIISATYQQILQPTQSGRLYKRMAQKIQPSLHGLPRYKYDGENYYLDMLFALALELDLLHCPQPPLREMKPTYEPDVNMDAWATLTMREQSQRLLQYWQDSQSWLDLYGEHFHRAYTVWDSYAWNPKQGRSIILKYLRKCQPGLWYSIPSLLQMIFKEEPLALYNTAYRHPNKPAYVDDRVKWMQADGEVYKGLLASSLYELGIVSLGDLEQKHAAEDEDDDETILDPDTFMLTELGAAVLKQMTSKTPEEQTAQPTRRALIVQPNFELLLLEEDLPTLYALLPFAQLHHAGRVSRLLLTRTSLLRGMNAGLTIERVLATLRTHSQKDLPQNVEYTLQDWSRGYKGARISQVLLIEVSSEALADEICSTVRFKTLRPRRIGPLAIAAYCDVNQIQRTLDKEGIALNFSGSITTPVSNGGKDGYFSHTIPDTTQ